MWGDSSYLSFRSRSGEISWWAKIYVLRAPLREGEPTVFWEVRGPVAFLGYTSASWRLSAWLNAQWSQLVAWWDMHGLVASDFVPSRKAVDSPAKSKPGAMVLESDDSPSEHVFSTELFVATFVFWSQHLKGIRRERSSQVVAQLAQFAPPPTRAAMYTCILYRTHSVTTWPAGVVNAPQSRRCSRR